MKRLALVLAAGVVVAPARAEAPPKTKGLPVSFQKPKDEDLRRQPALREQAASQPGEAVGEERERDVEARCST